VLVYNFRQTYPTPVRVVRNSRALIGVGLIDNLSTSTTAGESMTSTQGDQYDQG
jgi:hypothetical protein